MTAWYAGDPTAVAAPTRNATVTTCQNWTTPSVVSSASTAVSPAAASRDATSSRRRSTRSASAPAWSENSRIGRFAAALVTPSSAGEFVSVRTSQPWAVCCIHVPRLATSAPAMNRR